MEILETDQHRTTLGQAAQAGVHRAERPRSVDLGWWIAHWGIGHFQVVTQLRNDLHQVGDAAPEVGAKAVRRWSQQVIHQRVMEWSQGYRATLFVAATGQAD